MRKLRSRKRSTSFGCNSFKNIKINPKAYYMFIKSKKNIRDTVAAPELPEGILVLTDFQRANVLMKTIMGIFCSPGEAHVNLGTPKIFWIQRL